MSNGNLGVSTTGRTSNPEIYGSISYTWLTDEMLARIDTNYYYFDEESEMIISILPN